MEAREREISMRGCVLSTFLYRWVSMIRLSLSPRPSQSASWAILRPPSTSRRRAEVKKNRTERASGPDCSRSIREARAGDWASATQICCPTCVL